MPKPILFEPPPEAEQYLEAQATRIRSRFGRFFGKSPICAATMQALALSKLDLTDCPTEAHIVVKVLDQLSRRAVSPVELIVGGGDNA